MNTYWQYSKRSNFPYLSIESSLENIPLSFGIQLGTWFLTFVNIVPISMMVSLEVVKFLQGSFIGWDADLYDLSKDLPTKAQSSNLNEELGQVHYIFSDKTGTLTQNIMEFKCFSAKNKSYGEGNNNSPSDPYL